MQKRIVLGLLLCLFVTTAARSFTPIDTLSRLPVVIANSVSTSNLAQPLTLTDSVKSQPVSLATTIDAGTTRPQAKAKQAIPANCTHPDYAALADLYNATNGPNWTNKTGWLTDCNPCGWYGVGCSNGRVDYINMFNNNLQGSLPTSLSTLTNLLVLSISSNKLTGTIPASVGNLTQLVFISFSYNQLSGSIPDNISRLTNLRVLDLSGNKLSGAIPVSIGRVGTLQTLSLNSNQFTGSIPLSFSALTQLQGLSISSNQLSGAIPAGLSELTNLRYIYLNSNQLTGSIPSGFSALTNLEVIEVSRNQLNTTVSECLNPLLGLPKLSRVYLNYNQLSGPLPRNLAGFPSLTSIALNNNQLSGEIPASLGDITTLQIIVLDNNQLTGSIPASLTNLINLNTLSLTSNRLSGPIPEGFGSQAKLQYLSLSDNQLSGCFPISFSALCGKSVYVYQNPDLADGNTFADFCANRAGACIPNNTPPVATQNANQVATTGTSFSYLINDFADAETPNSLTYTVNFDPANGLSYNSAQRTISGVPIISGVVNVTVTAIDPGYLKATTTFQINISGSCYHPDIAALTDLYNATDGPNWANKTGWLTGCTPCGWYGVRCDGNGRVSDLFVDGNGLKGTIPASLGALTELRYLTLSDNQLTGSIPTSLSALTKLSGVLAELCQRG
jgi:Leucine-rich repeat (LRR) protein